MNAEDAKDIATDELRRLPDYADEDEPTGRHQAIVVENHTHVHAPQTSQPDVEVESSVEVGPVKVTGLPRWAVIALAALVAAVTAALAALARR
jgi:hypothetical protein